MLRVLIDATSIPADRGGVGRYVDNLVAAANDVQVIVACQAHDSELFRRIAPGAEVLAQSPWIRSTGPRLLWEQIALPRIAARAKADIVHSPHYTSPVLWRGPKVVTFHDMTFFSDPSLHTFVKRLFFKAWIRISGRAADALIADSKSTADETLHYTNPLAPIHVVHLGVDRTVFAPPSQQAVDEFAQRLGSARWIAFLGTLEPRKNVPALIRAVKSLSTRYEVPPLVIAGGQGWDPDVDPEIADTREGVVVRLGYVAVDDLAPLLGGADIVVYPSLGEGFGLPVLEAMACGGVVLTTRRLSIPEVGGDAVEYSGTSDRELEASLESLLDDDERRRRLRRAAAERAMSFGWERTADETLTVYRSVLK